MGNIFKITLINTFLLIGGMAYAENKSEKPKELKFSTLYKRLEDAALDFKTSLREMGAWDEQAKGVSEEFLNNADQPKIYTLFKNMMDSLFSIGGAQKHTPLEDAVVFIKTKGKGDKTLTTTGENLKDYIKTLKFIDEELRGIESAREKLDGNGLDAGLKHLASGVIEELNNRLKALVENHEKLNNSIYIIFRKRDARKVFNLVHDFFLKNLKVLAVSTANATVKKGSEI